MTSTNQNRRILKTVAMTIALAAVCAFAQDMERIRQISSSWPGASRSTIIALIVFFAAVIGVLISLYIGSLTRRNKIEQEVSRKLFRAGCEKCKLAGDEKKTLRAIASYMPDSPIRAHLVFEARLLFERGVDAYINSLARASQAVVDSADELVKNVRMKLGYDRLPLDQQLLSSRNIIPGQKLTLFMGVNKRPGRVGSVTNMREFYFEVKLIDGFADSGVQRGTELIVAFLRHGDAAYSASVRVLDVTSSGTIRFQHTLRFSRNQNRKYLRLDINLPLKYRVIPKLPPDANSPPPELFTTKTLDIGGGGLSFISEEAHAVGDMLAQSIVVGGKMLGGIKAKVLHVIPIHDRHTDTAARFKHQAQFVTIEPQQREHIVKYIFEKQREMLQMR